MFVNILTGLGTMAICLCLEGMLLVLVLRYYLRHKDKDFQPTEGRTLGILCGVMTLMVIGNLIQIGIWAGLFQWLSQFPDYPTAFYHSAVNFSGLGYGDLVMSEEYRLLGPLEAVNGILMVGVSIAALVAIFQDVVKYKFKKRINPHQTNSPNIS